MEKVRKVYIADDEFTPQNAAKASSAAEGLCKYVWFYYFGVVKMLHIGVLQASVTLL
jgi:hypothetical protein